MTSEISLSKDLIDLKGRNNYHVRVSVLRSYLLVLVCLLKRTSLELQSLPLFFFFSKIQGSKLGVRLIHGLLRYTDP